MPARSSNDSRNLNDLGPRLRALRKAEGLSLDQLAAKLQRGGWDCSKVTLSTLELRKRLLTDIEIKMILAVLNKTWADL